uniref:Methyltransferase small domain-containing protein n=1 Tax=Candidatus Kentrum sp. UNK TaxID=2126344 RepID=A0A451ASU7_9GAMM|nr:MAG: Methyltransferase small domain-containing protein [Candidatus Kentron sp. UNK]VFK69128.1 MAG: Methyltransferase small domain-containing protein [Candidatus Kentron sp. UNK]
MHNKKFNAYKSDVEIELSEPIEIPTGIDYAEKHRLLSSEPRRIGISRHGKPVYSCTVPENVFNPVGSMVPKRVVELILDGTIPVKKREVIDLGCGCGLIGLAAIMMNCQRVLFTDINPNVVSLREHPLLRTQDRVETQDVLSNESDKSWDTIIACPPSQALDRAAATDNYESGIFLSGDLISRIITQSARVLKPGGKFFLYVRLPHGNFMDAYSFLMQLCQHYDLNTMDLLDFATGKDFPYGDPDTDALFFSIEKPL